jgi:cytoskeletal protein RodZ
LRFLRLGILWFFLFMLAAFVLFVEFIAEVPGNAEPVPKPTTTPLEQPSPSPVSAAYDQLVDSSSNTKSPLS